MHRAMHRAMHGGRIQGTLVGTAVYGTTMYTTSYVASPVALWTVSWCGRHRFVDTCQVHISRGEQNVEPKMPHRCHDWIYVDP